MDHDAEGPGNRSRLERLIDDMVSRESKRRDRSLLGGRIALGSRAEWIKSAVAAVWYFGPLATALLVAARLGRRSMMHRLERRWARGVARFLQLEIEIDGLRHIQVDRPYVVAPLHEGFADILALLHLPIDLRFVALDELRDWRVLGDFLVDSRQVLIDPKAPRAAYRAMYRGGNEAAAHGESLVVFPQGSILGVETSFQDGAFRLADRLGIPVLPVVITGSHTVWDYPFSRLLRFRQRISVRVLPPVEAANGEDLERTMKDIALSAGMAEPRRYNPDRDGWWDGYVFDIDPSFVELAQRLQNHRAAGRTERVG